jgi:tRNA dimethylallyltransferase
MSKLVFCLLGPTASGKTALACELVKHFPFEIISVDSAMIYRDMNIGTAKPSSHELSIAPHHLINIKDPVQAYSAAEFCTDAKSLCDSIISRGKIPLLVGGTMMYFNAFQKGLSILPDADEALRKQIEAEALEQSWEAVYQKLALVDPITDSRIHSHDTQRIQRALEVYYLTGVPLSSLLAVEKDVPDYRFINFALFPQQRSWLHERIAQRFDLMLSDGFVNEVEQLQSRWDLHLNLPSMRCVGYRQVLEFLRGEYNFETMRDKGIAATRQLAKRQLTWLRHWDDVLLFDSQNVTFSDEIIAKTREILDNELL